MLEVGEQIGWVLFVSSLLLLVHRINTVRFHYFEICSILCLLQTDLGDPSEDFCPASVTGTPTLPPAIAPLPQLSEIPSASPVSFIDSEMPSAIPTESPITIETEAPIEVPTNVTAPSCPPVDTGGKSGIVNGGSGVAEKYENMKTGDKRGSMEKATEDMDRHLRTGGGNVECPEPTQPDASMKKDMTKDSVDKSPKEDVMKGSKGAKKKDKQAEKKDEDKHKGKIPVDSTKTNVSKAKKEKSMNATVHNVTLPIINATDGKGKGGNSTGKGKEVAKKSKGSTEDLDEDERKRSRVRLLH